jgi:hypothetical protein
MLKETGSAVTALGPAVTNGAAEVLAAQVPYQVRAEIKGCADLLLHRWNCEAIAEKARSAKGSKAKKCDDLESYIYRDGAGHICLPGEYVRQAIIAAAKFRQDPRSPRKSAQDLYKAGIVCLTELAALGPTPVSQWDYLHHCRVMVQRNGITRVRPAFRAGWTAQFEFLCLLPEYIRPEDLHDTLSQAGRLIGIGDFRPTYGRFQVTSFELSFGT